MHIYPDARAVVRDLRPDEPVILNRPHAARRAARFFVEKFPGKVLYAVKANPDAGVIAALVQSGMTAFDVASPAEMALVRQSRLSVTPVSAEQWDILMEMGETRL